MANTPNGNNLPVSTVLKKDEITLQELLESTLSKFLYLVHGTGSNRDCKMSLETLRDYFAQGGSMNPIVLSATGGGQEVTLTLTPSALTFTKVSGNPSVTTTRKIDFNGNDSFLDAMRLKTLSGATAIDATHFKLVVDTVTEFLENIIVGTSENKKNITLNGNLKIVGGKVDSDLVIGGNESDEGRNMTVHGACKADVFNNAGLLTITGDETLTGYEIGDTIYVYNSTSSTKTVVCMPAYYVEIDKWCALGFIKVANDTYAPLSNVTFHSVQ